MQRMVGECPKRRSSPSISALSSLRKQSLGVPIKNAIMENRDADLSPYLDFWFADAVACAEKLLQTDDIKRRGFLALALIDMEKAIIKTKESLLAEFKRLGIKPGGN